MAGKKNNQMNRYAKIIEQIFLSKYKKGKREFLFERDELVRAAEKLEVTLPKNLGDLIYSSGLPAMQSKVSDVSLPCNRSAIR